MNLLSGEMLPRAATWDYHDLRVPCNLTWLRSMTSSFETQSMILLVVCVVFYSSVSKKDLFLVLLHDNTVVFNRINTLANLLELYSRVDLSSKIIYWLYFAILSKI